MAFPRLRFFPFCTIVYKRYVSRLAFFRISPAVKDKEDIQDFGIPIRPDPALGSNLDLRRTAQSGTSGLPIRILVGWRRHPIPFPPRRARRWRHRSRRE